MAGADKNSFIPMLELVNFIDEQFVVLEGENAVSEEERARNSLVINGMETAYLAGKMAVLRTLIEFLNTKSN